MMTWILFSFHETAAKLGIEPGKLLALVQAGEISYVTSRPGPTRPWRIEDIDQIQFELQDLDGFNEGFTVSAFADRLGVPAIQVRRAIEDGDVAVTALGGEGYVRPRERILRADEKAARKGFRRWQRRMGLYQRKSRRIDVRGRP
jgi:hypothetical protein